MKKLLAFIAVCFAFTASSAIAKMITLVTKSLYFFQVDQKVDPLELLFTMVL